MLVNVKDSVVGLEIAHSSQRESLSWKGIGRVVFSRSFLGNGKSVAVDIHNLMTCWGATLRTCHRDSYLIRNCNEVLNKGKSVIENGEIMVRKKQNGPKRLLSFAVLRAIEKTVLNNDLPCGDRSREIARDIWDDPCGYFIHVQFNPVEQALEFWKRVLKN